MRKLFVFVITSVFGLFMFSANTVATTEQPLVMKPSMEQRYANNLARRFLTNWHYKDVRLDDVLSEQILNTYVESLDPGRVYFLAGDLKYFQRYQHSLDDAINHSELSPAYDIFNLYLQRVKERVNYAVERVEKPFDFTLDEAFAFDRSEASWAKNRRELDEIWRTRIKNDYLRLKLTEKDEKEIVKTLTDRYTNLSRRVGELNSEDVFQFFLNAFATSIEPHTSYLSPRTSENFEISMSLSLEGIGALLQRETEYTSIARVVPGGPANLDGRLSAGDRIIGVSQGQGGKFTDVIGWRLDDVVDLIRGPKDTVVRLEVLPKDAGLDGQPIVIDLVRDEVKLEEQAAKAEVIEVTRDERTVKVGVIEVPVFYLDFEGRARNEPNYRSTTRDVRRLIGELTDQGVSGLIIDLRNNGGGSLVEATSLTGLFIDKGPVVQVRSSRGRVKVERDIESGMAWDGPLAVMVNRYSASASEIFAAAIQDYGRGLIVGEPTYGKGTVQSLIDLSDYDDRRSADNKGLGQLKITMAQFFRINGESTQNKGVLPDISFPTIGDPDEYGESALDNALPWTQIKPASYNRVGNLGKAVAVLDKRHQARAAKNDEFAWLLKDIAEYNEELEKKKVSLLETVRRDEIAADEKKRKQREAARNSRENAQSVAIDGQTIPPLSPLGTLDEEVSVDEDADGEDEDEDSFDFRLHEAAEIVTDLVELNMNKAILVQDTNNQRHSMLEKVN